MSRGRAVRVRLPRDERARSSVPTMLDGHAIGGNTLKTSHIARTALITLPLLLLSNAALADSEDKKKTGAAESETPLEEQSAEVQEPSVPPTTTIVVVPPPSPPPATAQTPAPGPAVGTTQTTAAYVPPPNEAEQQFATRPSPVGNRVTLEPLVGYGTNNYNLGLGGRIGYTFAVPVYIGGSFMWYSGDKRHGESVLGATETKTNFYYPAVEVGYDFGLGARRNILVRPYAAGAIQFDRAELRVNDTHTSDTRNQFMIYPGLTARWRMPEGPLYVGADTRLLVPTLHGNPSYQLFFVTGLSM